MTGAIVRWFVGSMVLICLSLSVQAGGKKIDPIKLYDHQMHTDNFFTPNNIPCDGCHINNQYEWKGMNRDGCHNCHKSSKWLDYASKDCSQCHANYPEPANHKVNWRAQHKTEAKANAAECK